MKTNLLFLLFCWLVGPTIQAQNIRIADLQDASFVKANFTASSTSAYDRDDVQGLIVLLAQSFIYGEEEFEEDEDISSYTRTYNYKSAGLTDEDLLNLIQAVNPDEIIEKMGFNGNPRSPIFYWETDERGIKVLKQINTASGIGMGAYFGGHLDASFFKNLENIRCGFNYFKSVNLTKNKQLKSFASQVNPIKELDISQNTELEELYIPGIDITSLDLSQNIKLKSLTVPESLQGTLDLSNNLLLEDVTCYYSELDDVIFPESTTLEYIYFQNSQFLYLDLSMLPNLKSLDLSTNNLETLLLHPSALIGNMYLDYNKFKFSTLPSPEYINTSIPYHNYTYSSQKKIEGGSKGYFSLIDLSSEYNINGNTTTYTWTDKDTGESVQGMMDDGMGNFIAGVSNIGKTLLCKMTNSTFPELTLEYEVTISSSVSRSMSDSVLEKFKIIGNENLSNSVSLYPNPVSDIVNIASHLTVKEIKVYDYTGKELRNFTSVQNNQINIQDLPSGNYILTIKTDKETLTKKIIKR